MLTQTNDAFRVVIGNDCQAVAVNQNDLGLNDDRVEIINHPKNLGEVRNMNYLLSVADTPFFTWQADDDYYHPDFLKCVEAAIREFPEAECVFTGFQTVRVFNNPLEKPVCDIQPGPMTCYPGHSFVKLWLSNRVVSMAAVAVYKTDFLRRIGGIRALCDAPIGAFSEYDLFLRAGSAKRVVWIPDRLVYYRAHVGSWSFASDRLGVYEVAANHLITNALQVFSEPLFRMTYYSSLRSLMKRMVYAGMTAGGRSKFRPRVVRSFRIVWKLSARLTDLSGGAPIKHRSLRTAALVYALWLIPKTMGHALCPRMVEEWMRRLVAKWRGEIIC